MQTPCCKYFAFLSCGEVLAEDRGVALRKACCGSHAMCYIPNGMGDNVIFRFRGWTPIDCKGLSQYEDYGELVLWQKDPVRVEAL